MEMFSKLPLGEKIKHINLKSFDECNKLIMQGKTIAKDTKLYNVMFESLAHLVKLISKKNSVSAGYLENVAIPYYRHDYPLARGLALDLCEHLEVHYTKIRKTKHATAIALITRDIYKEMLFGDGK